jgi:hypothetical protein
VTDNEPDFNETGSLTDYILDLVAYHRRHANRVFANDLQALAARFALSWIALRVYEIGKKLKASGVRQSANVEIESEVIKVLERLLPDWHEEDDGTKHNGDVMCEITYGDVRSIKHLLAKLRPK